MTDREFHPLAALFPLLDGAEYDALKADIQERGLLEPIWLHPDGRILDGRNRYIACCDLGIEPRFRTWNGRGSEIDFVVSLNLHRRHLTAGQRAMVATDILPLKEAEARERHVQLAGRPSKNGGNNSTISEDTGKARDHAAALVGVNGRYVSEAKRIRELAPDLAEEVREGKKNIPYARRVLAARQSEERARERAQEPDTETPANVRLIVGDALNIDLPDESIDVFITSPPYNLGDDPWPMGGHGREQRNDGIGYQDALEDGQYQEWQLAVLDELYRLAKPGASLFYNHKTRTRNGVLLHPMTWLANVRGWTIRQEIIWDREVTHNHSATLFWPVDERIYWLTKGKPSLYGGSIGISTVWRFHGPQPFTWHPAPFSEELPRRCLQAIGGQGLTVLDPFAGSCTTVKVAADMGHEAIGVDISADYLARAREHHGW